MTSKLRRHRKTIMEEEKKTKERKFDLKKKYNKREKIWFEKKI